MVIRIVRVVGQMYLDPVCIAFDVCLESVKMPPRFLHHAFAQVLAIKHNPHLWWYLLFQPAPRLYFDKVSAGIISHMGQTKSVRQIIILENPPVIVAAIPDEGLAGCFFSHILSFERYGPLRDHASPKISYQPGYRISRTGLKASFSALLALSPAGGFQGLISATSIALAASMLSAHTIARVSSRASCGLL